MIGYYKCSAKTSRNAEFPIHVLYDIQGWPENTLKQRGLLGGRVAIRPADEEERRVIEGNLRAVSYKYKNVDSLCEDEKRCGRSPEFIDTLRKVFA